MLFMSGFEHAQYAGGRAVYAEDTSQRSLTIFARDIRLITRVSVRYGECNKCFILIGTPPGSFSH